MRLLAALIVLSALGANAHAVDDSKEEKALAREHFERGRTLYDLGRFDGAAKEFESAYEIRRDPAFLFNIAQSYRFAGKYQQALMAYRSFLRNLPEGASRPNVEKAIAELERLLQQQEVVKGPPTELNPPRPAVAPPSPTEHVATNVLVAERPPAKQPIYKKWWFWTTVGLVAAGGVAVGLGVGLSRSSAGLRVLPPATGGP